MIGTEIRQPTAQEKRVEAATWGVFFVWIGVCLLVPLPWGAWLIGVGAILLGAQLARRLSGLRTELFWLIAGAVFLVVGISEVAPLGVDIRLIPLLCIIAGLVLVARAFRFTRPAAP